jgi:hypothetical protein
MMEMIPSINPRQVNLVFISYPELSLRRRLDCKDRLATFTINGGRHVRRRQGPDYGSLVHQSVHRADTVVDLRLHYSLISYQIVSHGCLP